MTTLFVHKPALVSSATWTADGVDCSDALSYDDTAGMHLIKTANTFVQRRNQIPDWALNETKLRDVILYFVEGRAYSARTTRCNGTAEERLQDALKHLASRKTYKEFLLTEQCKRLVEMKNAGASRAEWRKLQQEIEGMDTELLWLGQEDKLAIGVAYRYYRLGMNSSEIGKEMGLKPPHVRQVIWRLNKYGARIAAGKTLRYVAPRGTPKTIKELCHAETTASNAA